MGQQVCIHGFTLRMCVVTDCVHWDGEPDPDTAPEIASTGERYTHCARCGTRLSDLRWRAGRRYCSDYCTNRGPHR
jgi:hypothetical protein